MMFNKPLFSFTFLFLSFFAAAQPKDQSSLHLAIGPSFPIGIFAKEEPSNNSSGTAKGGVFIHLGYNHHLGKKLGLTALLHVQRNALNTSAIAQNFNRSERYSGIRFHNILRPDPRGVPLGPKFANWKFDKASWRTISLLLGGYVQLTPAASQKLNITIRALLGPSYLSSPAINGEGITDTTAATASQTAEHAWSLGILGGVTGRYNINERFFVIAGVDFFGTSRMIIKDMTQSTLATYRGAIYAQGTTTQDARQLITTINASVGFGIRL